MMPKPVPPYSPVPSAPHVQAAVTRPHIMQWWIYCKCDICGPAADWQRPCSNGSRAPGWIDRYVAQHWHQ